MRASISLLALVAVSLAGCDSASPLSGAPLSMPANDIDPVVHDGGLDEVLLGSGPARYGQRSCTACSDRTRGRLRLGANLGQQFTLTFQDGQQTRKEWYVLKLERRASRRATLGVYRLATKRRPCDSDRAVKARLVRRVILRPRHRTTIPELSTTVYWPSAASPGVTLSYRVEVDPVPGTDPRPVPEPPVGSVFICPTISKLVIVP